MSVSKSLVRRGAGDGHARAWRGGIRPVTPSRARGAVYGKILFLAATGLAAGVIIGNAAKALASLDPAIRWFFTGCLVFFGLGASFLAAFSKAEREHEAQMAEWAAGGRDAKRPAQLLRRVK
ncbi:MAG: hypothetical protein FWF83_08590 [Clostridiales bacterium]|nr:hypothetical protein [Clostridiales bacterium]